MRGPGRLCLDGGAQELLPSGCEKKTTVADLFRETQRKAAFVCATNCHVPDQVDMFDEAQKVRSLRLVKRFQTDGMKGSEQSKVA